MATITARVTSQGPGETADLIGWEVKYNVSGDIVLPQVIIVEVPRINTDTEQESEIRQKVAEHANTIQTVQVFTESDVRGGKI